MFCLTFLYDWLPDFLSTWLISKVHWPVPKCRTPYLTSSSKPEFIWPCYPSKYQVGNDLICYYISFPCYPLDIYGQLCIYNLVVTYSPENTICCSLTISLLSLKSWSNINPPGFLDALYCKVLMNLEKFTRKVIVI